MTQEYNVFEYNRCKGLLCTYPMSGKRLDVKFYCKELKEDLADNIDGSLTMPVNPCGRLVKGRPEYVRSLEK